jgi:threonine dehydrogenase-like Zn-dependent dehydrogenase
VRAAVWNDHGSLDVVERPDPEPRPGWVRVRVAAAGICGTDLHFYRGSFPSPSGLLPGHEVGGTIDVAGEGAAVAAGTAVAVEPMTTCGHCPQCLTGDYTRCDERRLLGIEGRGGLADFMTAPAASIYALPDGLEPADGALVEPLAVCVRGVRLSGLQLGDTALVLGGGTIGVLTALCARAAGAGAVAVTARHDHQRQMAEAMGATTVASAAEAGAALGGSAPDVVLETVGGSAPTITEAVGVVRSGGTIVMLGVFDGNAKVPGLEFSRKEIRLVGSNCYARAGMRTDFDVAVGLLARHRDLVRQVVTHRFALADVNDAFAAAADKSSGSLKVAIEPGR